MIKFRRCLLRALCIVMVITLSICFAGCSSDFDNNSTIYADFEDFPSTLDPQLAKSESERIIVRNIFEGLMRYNEDGELKCGAAKEYKKSKDKLTYTFTLRDGLCWTNGEKLTADDFVFAFRRAVSPETHAPAVADLFAIKNASQIYSGNMSADNLGVSATDDKTVKIVLEKQDKNFLSTLTKPICMPCNKTCFTQAAGQYGRNDDFMVSNGSYYLKLWDTETKSIKLARNSDYKGNTKACNSGVYITDNKQIDNLSLLSDTKVDTVIFKYDEYQPAKDREYTVNSVQNVVWFLMINENSNSCLSNKMLRMALLETVDREALDPVLKENSLSTKKNMLPKVISKKIKPTISSTALKYNVENAQLCYEKAMMNVSITELTLTYIEGDGMQAIAKALAANWQDKLGAVVNILSVSSQSELETKISTGQYQMALVPVSAPTTKADDYMHNFSAGNIYGFNSREYDIMVNALDELTEKNLYRRGIINAQSSLFSNFTIYPIAGSRLGIASGSKIISQNFHLNSGYIDFAYFKKS